MWPALLAAASIGGGCPPAEAVLLRTVGPAARRFDLTLESGPIERAEVEAKDGRVKVRGTTPVAICRAAYEYMKEACGVQVSWSGGDVRLPARLPDFARREVKPVGPYRHYFNVCTFGYTTVWWDWDRWQREIDWMALHGINMPLAMNGQEAVWQRVFREYGVSDDAIRAHFSGPAFLPWHRMGNLNAHMGPLPQSWIDGQAALQKRILARERELGMKPVVPGFSGFVPAELAKVQPEVKLDSPTAWAGFAPTTFVAANNPWFVKIGKRFVEEYRQTFGSDHLYLCDTFNEQNPQFPAETELADLAACGKAVYESIRQGDPDGVWVMQGWLFYNARSYWTPAKAEAMLSGVPDGKMIVLDLATTEYEVWRDHPSVRRAGWIYNTLHNYGQNTSLNGQLQRYADVAARTLQDPGKGRLLGMGLTMEGIDQNPVVYELATDLMWRADPVDVRAWLRGYVHSRYGSDDPRLMSAWNLLHETVYATEGSWWYRQAWRRRPQLDPEVSGTEASKLRRATELLLSQAGSLAGNSRYERDLVDVAKTWLGLLADARLAAAMALRTEDPAASRVHRERFLAMLDDLDRVMATRPEHRLSTWVKDARSWGTSPAERDFMERNARTQVTVWGGPVLYDYANKEWAGLNRSFLKKRWERLFAALDAAQPAPEFAAWEAAWAGSVGGIVESKPEPAATVVRDLLRKHAAEMGRIEDLVQVGGDAGIAVGKPVRDSGRTEAGHPPSAVTDGSVFGAYWASSPYPQWIEIDLESVRRIRSVRLFPYRDGVRYYRYTVEGSVDGQTWKTLADAKENRTPAGILGHLHTFEPTEARFVRVTMLSNSDNVGVHLHEVQVRE